MMIALGVIYLFVAIVVFIVKAHDYYNSTAWEAVATGILWLPLAVLYLGAAMFEVLFKAIDEA